VAVLLIKIKILVVEIHVHVRLSLIFKTNIISYDGFNQLLYQKQKNFFIIILPGLVKIFELKSSFQAYLASHQSQNIGWLNGYI
jgi:hypothetical protein